jgi:hypothetical protein
MKTAFTTYAAENRAKGHYDTARRIEVEGKICRKLVQHALKSHFTVSVHDGEDWVVKSSSNLNAIMIELFATDSDTLVFRLPRGEGQKLGDKVGTVSLIYGNDGNDVISDWSSTDLETFTAWLKPVTDYANTL